jgi:hypothetical protein
MHQTAKNYRSYLNNVFWPNVFVGDSFQILDILKYARGLYPTNRIRSDGKSRNAGKPVPAAPVPAQPLSQDGTLNQIPIFEMASGEGFRP